MTHCSLRPQLILCLLLSLHPSPQIYFLSLPLHRFFSPFYPIAHRVPTGFFRYSVYASVAIVLTGTTVYLSVHAYVEYIALHGKDRIPVDGPDASLAFLPEELVPPFSGAHRGGGTDPALGWKARGAARAAYIALHVSKGGIANNSAAIKDVAVPDLGWLSAEGYLKVALEEIERQNDKSPESRDKTRDAERELRTQLASLQSKLGGPRGLREARANYMHLLSSMSSPEKLSPADTARWLDLRRRLADVTFQLTKLSRAGSAQAMQHQAVQQLDQALLAVLTGTSSGPLPALAPTSFIEPVHLQPEARASTGFSLKSLWPGHQDESQLQAVASGSIESNNLVQALTARNTHLAPSVERAISRALIDEVSMSAAVKQLSRAETVCNASLNYLRDAISETNDKTLDNKLYKTSLTTSVVLLQSYLAELLAAQQNNRKLQSSQTKSDANTRNILYEAVETAKQSVLDLRNFETLPGFSKSALRDVFATVQTSARRAAGLAHSTRAVLAEVKDKDYLSALRDYEVAHEYALAVKSSDEEHSTMFDRTLEGIRRCREKLTQT